MALTKTNPPSLPEPRGYAQVVTATGSRTVYVSGQVGVDRDAAIVGQGDVAAQAKQAYANLRAALEAAGATMADVAKINAYVVNYRPELFADLLAVRREAFGDHTPASTLAGVSALARPDYLFEVEAVAVLG